MPQRLLTDRFCLSAKSIGTEAQTDYFDEARKGLALRVTKAGSKSWTYHFTLAAKRVRMTFGTYPATSLASARTLADEAEAALEAGHDPRSALAKAETLQAICEAWVTREAAALRTGEARKAALKNWVYDELGNRPIADIRRSDIVRMLDRIEDEGGPAMADKVLAIIRRIFNWHASRSDDFHSPIVPGMARTKSADRARARILTDDEIRIVWAVAKGQGAFGRLIRFLLLTGARRTEAAAMPWAELTGAEWLLPGPRNKTKLDLLRPLPPAALAVIGPKPNGATFVFSNDGAGPLRGYGALKEYFDAAITAQGAEPLPRWTLHDLRRTARSLMSRAGVSPDHAERVLGHVIGGVRGTYDRHEYLDEKRDALAALARLVARIIDNKPTTLTLVRREAASNE
jgi:integrase